MTAWLRSVFCSILAELGCPRLSRREEMGEGERPVYLTELPDDWQDHCGVAGCEDCPPFSGLRNGDHL